MSYARNRHERIIGPARSPVTTRAAAVRASKADSGSAAALTTPYTRGFTAVEASALASGPFDVAPHA